jgi:hypothetical protein
VGPEISKASALSQEPRGSGGKREVGGTEVGKIRTRKNENQKINKIKTMSSEPKEMGKSGRSGGQIANVQARAQRSKYQKKIDVARV